jgi:hypothetical protein
MTKPPVSLRPVVEAIDALLKELESLEEPADSKKKHRARAMKASLEGTALMLRAECWSRDANESVYEFPA